MNTGDFRGTSLPALLMTLAFAWVSTAGAASISEPPLVVHGKVMKLGQGGGFQLFSGTLHVKLVNEQSPPHVLELDIPLRHAGANGEFSYRIEIDQETAPAADKLSTTLTVGSGETHYALQSATLDGYPASLLDPEQAAGFSTSFAGRGEEKRIDFRTDIPTPDTDGDGMPDWWEQLYGLDPNNAADALADGDGDGWNNLKEFQFSTHPLTANLAPVLQNSLLVVTAGGSNGVHLPIADADTTPQRLKLTLLEGGTGLVWKRAGAALALGDSLTYSEILAGKISVDVATSFTKDTTIFRLDDLSSAGVAPQELGVVVEAFSPGRGWLAEPVVWLDAGSATPGAPLEEWTDRSAYRRNGYQPYADARPVPDGLGRLGFHDSQFLYVDDKEMDLGRFLALLTFEVDAETQADQTLFSSSGLEISIGGPESGIHCRSLKVVQDGHTIFGPVVDVRKPVLLTLESTPEGAVLRVPGMGSFLARAIADAPLSSFTTVGARQLFSSAKAENFFNGSLREVVIYDRPVIPEIRGFLEDYQLARWQGLRVWNQRSSSQPVAITGAGGVRNTICGGECDDTLTGAGRADILRGGRGNNRLSGKGGADCFVFSKTGSRDVITDYSAAAGDSIDLTELFAGKTGLPSQYVIFKTLVNRDANNAPRVDTRLELFFGGTGITPDQTITLEGVGFGSSDLARLVGEGSLKLGGPRYDSVISLSLAADTALPGSPGKLIVSRSGNTDAAIQVPLVLGGAARVDVDYQIAGSKGTGSVRSVILKRGQTQAFFDIIASPDRSELATNISITVLPVAQVADGGAALSVDLAVPAENSVPVAHGYSIPTVVNTSKTFVLSGSDQDGDALRYIVVKAPLNGTLRGTAPMLTYKPEKGFTGSDSFTFKVNDGKADSAVATVTIKVTPEKSADATLSGLIVKAATLGPRFKPATTSYTASVPLFTKSVKIKPTASDAKATIKVNGNSVESGSLSPAIPLEIGKNMIKVIVTAEDGTARTYKIVVTRTTTMGAAAKSALAASSTSVDSRVANVTVNGRHYQQLTVIKSDPAARHVVEVSPDLLHWFSGDKHTTIVRDNGHVLTVRDNTAVTPGKKRFIRVKR